MKPHPEFVTVFTDDLNQHMVMLPNGEVFPGVIETITKDEVMEQGSVTLAVVCNIATDKEAALKIYSNT